MKLHQLRTFVAVADAGGIRGAARALNASPAAITKSLRQLEEDLQMPLVLRTSSGVTLTEAGQALLVHARLMVGQMTRAHEAMGALRGAARGKLTVAVTPWIAMTFLPETITRFCEKMPDVRLEFFEGLLSIANPRLRDGSLDFFVGRPAPGTPGVEFHYRPLFSSTCAVVAREGHPRSGCHSLADLCDLDWVLTWDPANDGPLVENMFSRHDVPMPSKIHLAHSFSIAISLLRQTDMVSVFPWPLVELCAARERLCAFPLREQLEDAMVSVISRSGHPLSEASECFIDCLIGTIRDGLESPSQQTRNVLRSVELLI
ncbi:LysR family transcriptional regulator [Caballeronia arationis]|jgi:DNA-binding transcriptional LysR family regulator|uniref:Transcriptional regulator, LysR family n=1 Tax=Caballeronia arationis TaxID=1777142 RepID=A0A7Z7N6U7_9BURK|nr:LysR substrate-binding domain-containing protein [Caballeronia arationis]SAL02176.1 LysR family transcriptional regulator [Caballeronia arationis]SOE89324.1 transcriptional regulator, LysR family [Caballeronia arationis]